MILYPLEGSSGNASGRVSAWDAVFEQQSTHASAYWLVAQPDHAALAGDLAANFSSAEFPNLDPAVLAAIGVHDAGWREFDGGAMPARSLIGAAPPEPMRDSSGRPLSFLEIAPPDFLRAWTNSIDYAENVSAIAAMLVSKHFCRLAKHRLDSQEDTHEDVQLIGSFLAREKDRQQDCVAQERRSPAEIERLVDVLQFCDLLSLYLCCGARREVSFPQPIASRPIRLRRDGDVFMLDPSPFGGGVSLGVAARRDPTSGMQPNTTTLPFLLR